MLWNLVPVIMVVQRGIQIPQTWYLVTFEIFRGVQEIDVEMADGTMGDSRPPGAAAGGQPKYSKQCITSTRDRR